MVCCCACEDSRFTAESSRCSCLLSCEWNCEGCMSSRELDVLCTFGHEFKEPAGEGKGGSTVPELE